MNDADYMKLALDYSKFEQANIVSTSLVDNGCVVFMVSKEPIPSASSIGIRLLRATRNNADTDSCAKEADTSNRALSQHTYTYVKAAATHDSRLESQTGNSKWSMSYTGLKLHTLRDTHDAFLAGVYSILQYKPFLTTRLPHGGKNPIRYVLNRHLRTPETANSIKTSYGVDLS